MTEIGYPAGARIIFLFEYLQTGYAAGVKNLPAVMLNSFRHLRAKHFPFTARRHSL